jgi:hypothetical protein
MIDSSHSDGPERTFVRAHYDHLRLEHYGFRCIRSDRSVSDHRDHQLRSRWTWRWPVYFVSVGCDYVLCAERLSANRSCRWDCSCDCDVRDRRKASRGIVHDAGE